MRTAILASQNRNKIVEIKAILEKYGLNACECLFIDDRKENVTGAENAGLNGWVFDGDYEQIIRRLTD